MTEKEKEEDRFLMSSDGVTVDEKMEEAKEKNRKICEQLKKERQNGNTNDE